MAPGIIVDPAVDIIDIRRDETPLNLGGEIKKGLSPPDGEEKHLSTLVLYDEKGLNLFEAITYLDEYYLTNAEIDVLERYASAIAQRIPRGARVIELGSGNLRKVRILLNALDRLEKNIDYYALDLSLLELERTLLEIPPGTFDNVRCHGLHGTYDDGLAWLQGEQNTEPTVVMSLGSSIGNFSLENAASFLQNFASCLGSQDLMIVCCDGCQESAKVYKAYHDAKGTTDEFYRNGLKNANRILGMKVFTDEDFDIVGNYDVDAGRHETFVVPREDRDVGDFHFNQGEKIRIENSHKFSDSQQQWLWHHSGLNVDTSFRDRSGTYSLNMLSKRPVGLSLDPVDYAHAPVPTLAEWDQIWQFWDLVTRKMIPEQDLLSKPINLRNCCLFYLGHIPTFVDIHLTRATGGKPTEPKYYPQIFERGIDPDVENPEMCHDHSEIPDEWPPVEEILQFQKDVRLRIRDLSASDVPAQNRNIARALWLGFEHEVMHLETLLYMLLQSDKVVPPTKKPDFEALAHQAHYLSRPSKWVKIPERVLHLGLFDPDNNTGPDRFFGWDNEKPIRKVKVPSFEALTQPVTNGDYARYLSESNSTNYPASWAVGLNLDGPTKDASQGLLNGYAPSVSNSFLEDKAIKTVYGPVPLKFALDWPVMASYDELLGCAKWMNGRIPTMEEARSIYEYVEQLDAPLLGNICGKTIPAVNGHLSNEGVQETPPQGVGKAPSAEIASISEQARLLFADLRGCNVGFQAFHPVSVTHSENPVGLGGMGGVWEWTSSVLKPHDGFKAMDLYPGYTSDFFDGKHNIVLGGSWATHPKIAGRKTFVNWYQRNYPYAWCGARLVRDVDTLGRVG